MRTDAEIEALQHQCAIGVGGRNALADANDLLAYCYAALGRLLVDRKQLGQALIWIAEIHAKDQNGEYEPPDWLREALITARQARVPIGPASVPCRSREAMKQ
jgi:hypothetical protein